MVGLGVYVSYAVAPCWCTSLGKETPAGLNNATTADAYATAFMIMGLDKAKQFLAANKDLHLQVYFIFDENGKWNIYSSPELQQQTSRAWR